MSPAEAAECAYRAKQLWPTSSQEHQEIIVRMLVPFPDPAFARKTLDALVADIPRPNEMIPRLKLQLDAELRRRGLTHEARNRVEDRKREQEAADYWARVDAAFKEFTDEDLEALKGDVLRGMKPAAADFMKNRNPRTSPVIASAIYDRLNRKSA